MEHNILKKERIKKLYKLLFEHGEVECEHTGVEEFIYELGELIHHNERFKKIKDVLKNDTKFQQRFESEIRRIVQESKS